MTTRVACAAYSAQGNCTFTNSASVSRRISWVSPWLPYSICKCLHARLSPAVPRPPSPSCRLPKFRPHSCRRPPIGRAALCRPQLPSAAHPPAACLFVVICVSPAWLPACLPPPILYHLPTCCLPFVACLHFCRHAKAVVPYFKELTVLYMA